MARGGVVRLSKLSKSTIAYALSLLQIKILLMLFFTRLIEFRLFCKGLIFIAPVQSSCGSQPSQMSKCISNSDKSTPEAFFNTNNVNFPWSVKWGGSKTCKATTVAFYFFIIKPNKDVFFLLVQLTTMQDINGQ